MKSLTIYEMRKMLNDTQNEFSNRFNIPFRTIQNWEAGVRKPPEYVLELLSEKVRKEVVNHMSLTVPRYDPRKANLPSVGRYMNPFEWLKDVSEMMGENVVFALDQALFCYSSKIDNYSLAPICVYGDVSLRRFNNVLILGEEISPKLVDEKSGIKYTNFKRTLFDSFVNEKYVDKKLLIDSLEKYFIEHKKSFDDLYIPDEYEERFRAYTKSII